MKKIAVVGAGIVGLSVAYKMLLKHKNLDLTIFEKEDKIGSHQSGRNSGVLHCGLYYKPGSLKAKLAVEGIREMTTFCIENEVEHDICGKVVAASNQREALILDGLFKRGVKNGLKGLKFLDSVELKEREPFVSAKKALLVPEEGIVDFKSVMRKLLFHIENMGGKIVYNANILDKNSIGFTHDELDNSFDWIVNCTGLYSDKVYEATLMLGTKTDTLDLEGSVIEKKEIPQLETEKVDVVLKSFVGEQLQTPPMYSAKKVNGQRLYKLARKNIEVEREPSSINIFEIELNDFISPLLSFRVKCSKGTYIRVLGSDIAEKLGTVGHLIALKRVKVGDYTLNETIRINELEKNGCFNRT